ncbi:MAG: beta-lactamase family protein [Candidatus Aminicenantes bacterium]
MKKTVFKGIFFVFLSCLLIAGCQSQSQKDTALKTDVSVNKLITKLEKDIPVLMEKARIPGLSIAVIKNGKIIWTEGFGIKNTKTGESVNKYTVFEAASLTKPFFAFLVMKMVESGELDLDRPLHEYVPQEFLEKRYIRHSIDLEGFRRDWFERITARMVLSHSSGLPHGGPRKPLPVLFEPGSEWRYSADGYMCLQRIVEHIKGERLKDIMLKEIIDPLEMTNSSMVWREKYETQSAVGHDVFSETTGRFRKRRSAHSAASLYTTAEDYAKFVAAVLNDKSLSSETIKKMLTPQIDCEENVSWSLGFGLEKTDNGYAFWQWGDYGIFRNYIVAYKEQKIGIVYLTNSFNGLSIGQDIVGLAIGGGEDLGLSFLDYDRYDSPGMVFTWTVVEEGMEEAKDLFHRFRQESPEEFDEGVINRIGYTLLNADRVDEAIEVFKLNVDAFPGSANTYDSLSDAYIKKEETELAIEAVKKTLEVIPKDTTRDKTFLENLKNTALEKLKKLKEK